MMLKHQTITDRTMSNLSKRSTIYFEPAIHQALKIKAASSHTSVSELVDEAIRLLMREDQEDLKAISDRVNEPEISYEALLDDLKKNGKI
jgi:hypothetical protein